MNLSIITTLGSNFGDNFIYEGFKNVFPSKHYDSMFLIDKTTIPKDNKYKEFIDNSDLIVICGSPIFYSNCYKMPWQNKILEYSKKSGRKILLFAVGSNFRCSSDGEVLSPDIDKRYTEFIFRYKEALFGDFIVRDRYCFEFLRRIGISNIHQTVCPSLFADSREYIGNKRDLVFIIWGSTHWNCDLTKEHILGICKKMQSKLISAFGGKRIVWVCHDISSYIELTRHFPKREILFSNNYIDYLKYYERCYFAFSIKVHGTMLLASMGIPSLLMQLDSRASVIESLGESYATPSIPIEQLSEMCIEKIKNGPEYRDRIKDLKVKYKEDYNHLFEGLGLK